MQLVFGMGVFFGLLVAVLLGQHPSVGKTCHFLQARAQEYITGGGMVWRYGTAEMMEKPKCEERAEVISSPVAAGSSVFGVSTLLLAVQLSGNISYYILF